MSGKPGVRVLHVGKPRCAAARHPRSNTTTTPPGCSFFRIPFPVSPLLASRLRTASAPNSHRPPSPVSTPFAPFRPPQASPQPPPGQWPAPDCAPLTPSQRRESDAAADVAVTSGLTPFYPIGPLFASAVPRPTATAAKRLVASRCPNLSATDVCDGRGAPPRLVSLERVVGLSAEPSKPPDVEYITCCRSPTRRHRVSCQRGVGTYGAAQTKNGAGPSPVAPGVVSAAVLR